MLSHFGRPKGKSSRRSCRSPDRAPARGGVLGQPVAFAEDCIGARPTAAVDAPEGRRRPAAGEPPLPRGRGEERPGLRRGACRDSATSTSTTPSPPRTARMPRPRALAHLLPASAGRLMQAELEALERRSAIPKRPVVADRRRRQGLDQARPARQPRRARSTRWSSAAAWPTPSSPRRASTSASRCASTTSPTPPARSWPRRRRPAARSCCRSTCVVAARVQGRRADTEVVASTRARRRA